MSGMDNIRKYFTFFEKAVARFENLDTYEMDACIDAYEALHRLRDRVNKEYPILNNDQKRPLYKFFSNDSFAKGMSNIRTVGAHVKKRDNIECLTIVTPSNQPIELPIETSALQVFEQPVTNVLDIHGTSYPLDHMAWLTEALNRARNAVSNAENAR